MSIKETSRVWEHSKQESTALLVILAIADCANDWGHAWPGQEHIAKYARAERETVTRLIGKMETDGELYVARRKGRVTHYVILVGLSDEEQTERKKRLDAVAQSSDQKSLPHKASSDRQITRSGDPEITRTRRTVVPETPHDPSVDPLIDPSRGEVSPPIPQAEGEAVRQRLAELGIIAAKQLSEDPWVTMDRINRWAEELAADWSLSDQKRSGYLVKRLREHIEPPATAEIAVEEYEEVEVLYIPPAPKPAPHDPNKPRPPHLIWQAAYGQLEVSVPRETFDTWLRDCCLIAYEDGTYVLGVANAYAVEWLTERLQKQIARTLTHLAGRTCEVQFVVYQRGKS